MQGLRVATTATCFTSCVGPCKDWSAEKIGDQNGVNCYHFTDAKPAQRKNKNSNFISGDKLCKWQQINYKSAIPFKIIGIIVIIHRDSPYTLSHCFLLTSRISSEFCFA